MCVLAHSHPSLEADRGQSLAEHLHAVSKGASERGAKFGAANAAALAGLLHDVGKYTKAFQARVRGSNESAPHALAGARLVNEGADGQDLFVGRLVAHVIAGHHAGLPDWEGDRGLRDRFAQTPPEALFTQWKDEVAPGYTGLNPNGFRPFQAAGADPKTLQRRGAFQLAFLGRMILSCLVDADYTDTAAYYAAAKGEPEVDPGPSALGGIMDAALEKLDAALTAKAGAPPPGSQGLHDLRQNILAHVHAGAAREPGLFTLTVPTGGGKTLASLAFALDHAARHGLDRVIYAIPFTSIVDQTASIFKALLGDDAVLEHHSAIEESAIAGEGRAAEAKLRLAMETWAKPVVVTTTVQLFESLFSNRPARCRKLHNLANSVIILDEAQTIPRHVLTPCVAALDELALNYGTSIVLCTATQPALLAPRTAKDPGLKGGFAPERVRELAPDPADLARRLTRVTIRPVGVMDDDAVIKALSARDQGLVIVNSRKHALGLYRLAQAEGLDGAVHLTTRMCAAHRRVILEDVRARLKGGAPCRVIATSLIEAGVDVDFPAVWRAEAGLDSIAQAAGRCNREGRAAPEDSIVTVFRPAEVTPPGELKNLIDAFTRTAEKHEDFLSPAAIEDYFGEVFYRVSAEGLDKGAVMAAFNADRTGPSLAYRTVAETFRLIEDGMATVITPYDAAVKMFVKSVIVDDQSKALAFYRDTLGFVVKHDIPMGEFRWLTLVSPEEPDGVELALEPNQHPAARRFQAEMKADGIPWTAFSVADLDAEFDRLQSAGVKFVKPPMKAGDVAMAIFDDTCGNLIQLIEAAS